MEPSTDKRDLMSIIRHPIWQYAYFVEDIDEACKKWNKMVGAGPFHVVRSHNAENFQYLGEHVEADVSYAFGQAGPAHIQFIAQHDDTPSIYRDMYKPGEYGFHHIGLLIHDVTAEVKRFNDEGYETACTLWIVERIWAAMWNSMAMHRSFGIYSTAGNSSTRNGMVLRT